jgi:hypothetical protein
MKTKTYKIIILAFFASFLITQNSNAIIGSIVKGWVAKEITGSDLIGNAVMTNDEVKKQNKKLEKELTRAVNNNENAKHDSYQYLECHCPRSSKININHTKSEIYCGKELIGFVVLSNNIIFKRDNIKPKGCYYIF